MVLTAKGFVAPSWSRGPERPGLYLSVRRRTRGVFSFSAGKSQVITRMRKLAFRWLARPPTLAEYRKLDLTEGHLVPYV